jgi:hypothetical protein
LLRSNASKRGTSTISYYYYKEIGSIIVWFPKFLGLWTLIFFHCMCGNSYKRSFQKGWCTTKTILARPFECQKSPTYSVCEKHMIETSCNAFMSISYVSFEKGFFTKGVA